MEIPMQEPYWYGVAEPREIARTEAIAVLVALSLCGSILVVWLYVVRNIVRRLNQLSGAMFKIAAGGHDTAVPVAGGDEIAAMGEAVEIFRCNAVTSTPGCAVD